MSASLAATLVEIGMPKLSDSMEEATVLRWLRRPGEVVKKGDELVEVETDKATIVYEAERDGVLDSIVVDEGESAQLGAVIARLRVAGAVAPEPPEGAAAVRAAPPEESLPTLSGPRLSSESRPRATPIARRLAVELGVDLRAINGTGPSGRIVGADVRREAAGAAAAHEPMPDAGRGSVIEKVLSPTQRTIAHRMTESRADIPEFTLEAEIMMEAALHLREDLRAGGSEPLPSLNDLTVRAAALALRDFPALNASYSPGKAVHYGRVNVGIAVATEDSLLVPVVRDADAKSVFEIAAETRRLVAKARDRSIAVGNLEHGTFTVSNLGMFGVRRFHAVINRPQAAILAVGEVAKRAVIEGDTVVARTMMEVSLSCDHRIVYGAEAALFLGRVRLLLEHPTLLLIDRKRM
jgi:pyruvate dehydrogenase E2 component (dihydrolipoamide acetyltransferase)